MKFNKTKFNGVYIIELEKKEDDRGFLTRILDKKELEKLGIKLNPVEGYLSSSKKKGTLRGLHYRIKPNDEVQLTRISKGSAFEVVVDLRKNTPTYKKWLGFYFKSSDYKMLLIPPFLAHAILTLEDGTEITNLYTKAYNGVFDRGIRFDDPQFKIKWPIKVDYVSQKDQSWPDFKD